MEGEARAWYKGLPNNSIDRWNSFNTKFLEIWGDKHHTSLLLINYANINKKDNETILEFNTCFSKDYHKISATARPNAEFDPGGY